MRRYKYDERINHGWKSHPVRILGPRKSQCHQESTILVESMSGGYVSANCSQSKCNKKESLSQDEFENLDLWVNCPGCKKRMTAGLDPHRNENYVYFCEDCQIFIWFSDLLPHWENL
jgi:hypothetical protein